MATLDKIRLSGTTYDIIDATAIHSLDGYYTSGETNNAITAATSALAQTIAEQGYQTSGDVQNAISGKANSSDAIKTIVPQVYTAEQAEIGEMNLKITKADGTNSVLTQFIGARSGITITKNIYSGADLSVDTTVIAQKTDIPSVTGYADSVKYNSTSKYVEFYHGGTGGTKVFEYDASPFLIDGMVENVEIKDVEISGETVTCLVITFNTDAGKQAINIPISEIFDASNYYTKTEIDEAISGFAESTAVTQEITAAVSGKADTTAVTAINDVLTAHTANTTIHVTSNDKSTWSGKQDALVSGTNIKTVGGESLLGSGNIAFPTGLQVEVSGTTLVFS